jgi:hypothetical protein
MDSTEDGIVEMSWEVGMATFAIRVNVHNMQVYQPPYCYLLLLIDQVPSRVEG